MSHTLGPWKYERCHAGFRKPDERDFRIASHFCTGIVWGTDSPEGEANARLIAAAPDLLDAILKSDDAHWTPSMRAAIAKATGQ